MLVLFTIMRNSIISKKVQMRYSLIFFTYLIFLDKIIK